MRSAEWFIVARILHAVLLTVSLFAIKGAVAGPRGYRFFASVAGLSQNSFDVPESGIEVVLPSAAAEWRQRF